MGEGIKYTLRLLERHFSGSVRFTPESYRQYIRKGMSGQALEISRVASDP